MDRQFQILTGQESNLPSDTSKRLYIIDDTHRVILDTMELKTKDQYDADMGEMTDLETSAKKIVDAINEVNSLAHGQVETEHVTVILTTSMVGIDLTNREVLVYINESENPNTYTTDENGTCKFVVNTNVKYTIVFPTIEGCETPSSESHIASTSQRSIEKEYVPEIITEYEHLIVNVYKSDDLGQSGFSGVSVFITINGVVTEKVTDENGQVDAEILYGSNYVVKVNKKDGYNIRGGSSYSLVASIPTRNVEFDYKEINVGIYIVDEDWNEYTLAKWIESGKEGSSAKFISVNNTKTCFGLYLDDICVTELAGSGWCESSYVFQSLPLDGASSTTEPYYYDGQGATNVMLAEKYSSAFIARMVTANTVTMGGRTKTAFLGSYGQFEIILNNITEINEMVATVRPNQPNVLTNFNKYFIWTATQASETEAYALVRNALGKYKKATIKVIVPIYDFS